MSMSVEEFLKLSEEPKRRTGGLGEQILTLCTNQPMTVAELARLLNRPKASIYAAVQRLVKKGLLEKRYTEDGKLVVCRIVEE